MNDMLQHAETGAHGLKPPKHPETFKAAKALHLGPRCCESVSGGVKSTLKNNLCVVTMSRCDKRC